MSLQIDFGPTFGYLLAAYGFVALAMGGYLMSLVRHERELARMRKRRADAAP